MKSDLSHHSRFLALITAFALIGAAPTPTPPSSYALDHIVLGSSLGDIIAGLGPPSLVNGATDQWNYKGGATLTVTSDTDLHVTLIDVTAGKDERRTIDAAGGGGTLGESGHVNFIEPANATSVDSCGASFIGSPCLAFTLPGGVELVANFGKDNHLSDWALSELVLGKRDLLLASGRVIAGE